MRPPTYLREDLLVHGAGKHLPHAGGQVVEDLLTLKASRGGGGGEGGVQVFDVFLVERSVGGWWFVFLCVSTPLAVVQGRVVWGGSKSRLS